MHGLIHCGLKLYVETRLGTDAWNALAREAGLAHKRYVPIGANTGEDATAVVAAAARLAQSSPDALLEDFGRFLVPTLMDTYRKLIAPEWKTLELLLNTEANIHCVVRRREPAAEPPRLRFERSGPTNSGSITNRRAGSLRWPAASSRASPPTTASRPRSTSSAGRTAAPRRRSASADAAGPRHYTLTTASWPSMSGVTSTTPFLVT
jgi:hypothetical protein